MAASPLFPIINISLPFVNQLSEIMFSKVYFPQSEIAEMV